jgi:hypothetical protein
MQLTTQETSLGRVNPNCPYTTPAYHPQHGAGLCQHTLKARLTTNTKPMPTSQGTRTVSGASRFPVSSSRRRLLINRW